MSVLNLYDGLEAIYSFEPRFFDGTDISDRSGYERHATASGGPSVSENGYRNFGAATFDGSDDEFDSGDRLAVSGAQTVLAIHKNAQVDVEPIASNRATSDGISLRNNGTEGVEALIFDGNGDPVLAPSGIDETDRWYVSVARFTGSEIQMLIDGELKASQSVSSNTTGNSNFKIARNSQFSGDVSLVGRWSRALSDAEIAQLSRLTGPREARL